MEEEKRKYRADIVRGFYLYSYRSKGENILRGVAWVSSWVVGIWLMQSLDLNAKGGAYFIYASSMMLEFIPENKRYFIPRLMHGLFCLCLITMFLLSLVFSFGGSKIIPGTDIYAFFSSMMHYVEIAIIVMLVVSIILVLIQPHKIFYDEEKEMEDKNEAIRRLFYERLNSSNEGKGNV